MLSETPGTCYIPVTGDLLSYIIDEANNKAMRLALVATSNPSRRAGNRTDNPLNTRLEKRRQSVGLTHIPQTSLSCQEIAETALCKSQV